MGPVGVPEMFLIFLLALLLFGPKKLPELGRMLGKGLSEFRRAKNELKSTFETHMRELERETQPDSTSSTSTALDYSSRPYPYPYDEYGQESSNQEGSNNGYTSELPAETSQSSETGASEPAHTSPAPQQEHGTDQFHSDPVHSATEQTQIAGTVSRSNGVRPVEPVSVPAEEDHRG